MTQPSGDGRAALVEELLAAATGDAVVALCHEDVINARWANSSLTTNGIVLSEELIITAIADVADGRACATRAGPVDRAMALLREAESAARASTAIADAVPLPAGGSLPGFREGSVQLSPETVMAPTEGLARAFGDRSAELFGYAEQSRTTTWVGTTAGPRWRSEDDTARFEVSAKADRRQLSAWAGRSARSLAEVEVVAGVSEAILALQQQRRTEHVPAQPMPVILTPSAVADLMVVLWWQATGREAAEGTSAFAGRGDAKTAIGTRLSGRRITLRSDPKDPELSAPGRLWTPWISSAASVFDTGAEIMAVDWITDGVLTNLQSTRATSAEFDLPFRPSADNLILTDADGNGDLWDLVARTDRALLVTSLWYIRDVDPQSMLVTGLTRDGTYLVEGGEVVGACGNFRFNDSPLRMLARIADASSPVRCLPREQADYFTRTRMPALLIDDFGLSTPSEAI